MLIGFGAAAGDEKDSDASTLQRLGCERSFLWADKTVIREELDRAIEFLRPGDILVATDLTRFTNDILSLVALMQRLQTLQIGVRVESQGIVPGTAVGDAFAKCCSILADAHRSFELERAAADDGGSLLAKRQRGRPAALSLGDRMKAKRLLSEGRMSVSQIARLLRVSTATIYRYFPQRSRIAGQQPAPSAADLAVSDAANKK
ncbi:MAG: recombinase family protein [Pseudolabrys sp.]